MEWKIGEIRQVNGEWYQCVQKLGCDNCNFLGTKCCNYNECSPLCRTDKTSVIFKKLEKIGGPYDDCGAILQRFKIYTNVTNADTKGLELHIYSNDTIGIEIKQTKEDMEEKNNGNTPLNVLTDKYVNGDICYDDFEKEVKALYSCKEEIKPTLKEFDLEAAKLGKPVCTRNGHKARIICFDRRFFYKNVSYPILALVERSDGEDDVCGYNEKGKVLIEDGAEHKDDLMMLPEKKEGWVNVYENRVYSTKEEALDNKDPYAYCMTTIKVSWEE